MRFFGETCTPAKREDYVERPDRLALALVDYLGRKGEDSVLVCVLLYLHFFIYGSLLRVLFSIHFSLSGTSIYSSIWLL